MKNSNSNISLFVRDEMLTQTAPPNLDRGILKWIKQNLFSSWLNALLTIVSLWLIYVVIGRVGPWFGNAVWTAGSLGECREIRDALYGPEASSACFAVIGARWEQLLFGFYPSGQYWRPILAFVLFLGAVAPVLMTWLPRRTLLFTLVIPFVIFHLLWGGSVWFPCLVAAGFFMAYLAYKYVSSVNLNLCLALTVLLPIVFWSVLLKPLDQYLTSVAPWGLEFVPSKSFGGFTLSFIIGISAIVLSLPIGIAAALARQSNMLVIKVTAVTFIEVIRGIPLIVWLFTASLLLNYFLPPGTNFDLMLRVIIMVTLFSAAYIGEVIRGGLAAIPKGQNEAAQALGLNYWNTMRLVILPQALKVSIPGIVNTFIGLFKDTTLVVFIGLLDPIGLAGAIRSTSEWNGIYWELYAFIGLLFFVCCFSMGQYSLFLEKQLKRDHK